MSALLLYYRLTPEEQIGKHACIIVISVGKYIEIELQDAKYEMKCTKCLESIDNAGQV